MLSLVFVCSAVRAVVSEGLDLYYTEPLAGWPIQDCILVWACTDNVLTIPGTQKRFGETPAETRGVVDQNYLIKM